METHVIIIKRSIVCTEQCRLNIPAETYQAAAELAKNYVASAIAAEQTLNWEVQLIGAKRGKDLEVDDEIPF